MRFLFCKKGMNMKSLETPYEGCKYTTHLVTSRFTHNNKSFCHSYILGYSMI